jgi:hypothetical protein
MKEQIKYYCRDLGEVTLSPSCKPYKNATCGEHARLYSQKECDEMNKTDPRVHEDEYWCQWVVPYGFVPETGCPKHD